MDPLRFRRELAAGLLGLLGAASSLDACDGGGATGAGGAGGAGTTTTGAANGGADAGAGGASTGSGGSASDGGSDGSIGPMPVSACLSFPIDAGADVVFDAGALPGTCPADPKTVVADFQALGCPFGFEPYRIVSGPTMDAQGDCCYLVLNILCGPGGRPFLVGGEARVATAASGPGWTAGDAPATGSLTPAQRALLAEAWTTDALHEHASIASFARFSLDLLAAGAPADLLDLAHRAALDEVRHARLCFALASAYAGRELAPGPLPLHGAVPVDGSLAALAAATFAEGCVGETVAAVVAAEQLARATDPAVRAALAEIAADEARHAALAWRTVSWALAQGGPAVRAAVEQALRVYDGGPSEGPPNPSGHDGDRSSQPSDAEAIADEVLSAHGRLSAADEARAVAGAIEEVVLPAARALLRIRPEAPSTAGRCSRAPAS
jgi:hypothetical protein